MFAPTIFDPGLPVCVLTLTALGALAIACGAVLVPANYTSDDWLARIAGRLVSGLVFLAGIGSILCLHRLSYVTLMPLMQIGFAAWSWRTNRSKVTISSRMDRLGLVWLLLIMIGGIAFEWWNTGWQNPDGSLRIIHYDLGYYAQMIHGILESKVADGWSATLGAYAAESPQSKDGWYHWSPLWLAGSITKLTGMMPLASLLHVVATLLDIALVLVTGAIVRQLTRLSVGRSLLIGAASVIAVQLLRSLGQQWLGLNAESDSLQHSRQSLAYAFAYKFEGMVLLLALLCWLRQNTVFSLVMLACAAVSAPHSVAVGGVTAGVLGVVGLLLRKRQMCQTAAGMIAVLLTVWGVLHVFFGAGLSGSNSLSSTPLSLDMVRLGLRKGLLESCSGLLLGTLSLPGILHLIFARDERSTEEMRILGWMALSAVVGSFMGYRLLPNLADNLHFVLMSHAVLVMPAGIWGLARLATSASRSVSMGSIALIVLMTGMGAADLQNWRRTYGEVPWKKSELDPLKLTLQGRPFGYFAKRDRPWWLPWHSSLAALLDSRCVRLQEISGELTDAERATTRPYELVPIADGETEDEWSMRFARKIGVEFIIEFGQDTLPPTVKTQMKQVASVPLIKLYQFKAGAPK